MPPRESCGVPARGSYHGCHLVDPLVCVCVCVWRKRGSSTTVHNLAREHLVTLPDLGSEIKATRPLSLYLIIVLCSAVSCTDPIVLYVSIDLDLQRGDSARLECRRFFAPDKRALKRKLPQRSQSRKPANGVPKQMRL